MDLPADRDSSAWVTAVATAVAYGVLLVAMFLVLFVAPYLLFRAL